MRTERKVLLGSIIVAVLCTGALLTAWIFAAVVADDTEPAHAAAGEPRKVETHRSRFSSPGVVAPRAAPLALPTPAPMITTPQGPRPVDVPAAAVGTWKGPLPSSLADVPRTPQLDAQEPQIHRFMDYKIKLLREVEKCAEGKVKSPGSIGLFLHFAIAVEDGKTVGTGTTVDLRESDLPVDEDAIATECIQRAHVGHKLEIVDRVDGDEYHWGSDITFPIRGDRVFGHLAQLAQ